MEFAERIGRLLEAGSIEAALEASFTPGLSLAVIEDHEVVWSEEFGLRRAGTSHAVLTDTRFQAASISKPVAACVAMKLVEQRKLDLDSDINGFLSAWTVRREDGTPVLATLRQLLSHTAGLTVPGFPGYPHDAAVPGILEILDGLAPANTPSVRSSGRGPHPFAYSGGGYVVLQHLIDSVAGSFERAAGELFSQAQMAHSSFSAPRPEEAAFGHQASGEAMPTGWMVHPELCAAGLWTTAADVARFAIAVSRSFVGLDERVLSRSSALTALYPRTEGVLPPWTTMGLGFFLNSSGKQVLFAGHTGGNQGYRSVLRFYPARGCGAVVLTNGDNGALVWSELLRTIASEFRWPTPEL